MALPYFRVGAFANVLDYGADPTGTVDSTAAFQSAMAAGVAVVPALQPDGSTIAEYIVSNCIVPSGASLIGFGAQAYPGGGIASDTSVRPYIVAKSNAIRMFNVDGKKGVSFQGLNLSAATTSVANSADIISAGGYSVTVRDCCFAYCKNGIGGQVAGSSSTFPNATWELDCYNCEFSSCINGIYGMVDCWVVGSSFSSCQYGVYIDGVSSAINLIGNRYEWCGRTGGVGGVGYGLYIAGGTVHLVGGEFDANGEAGIYLNGAFMVSITGAYFQRNGSNVTSGTTLKAASAHIQFNNAYNINITGCTSRGDVSDGTVYCPAAWANFAGTNGGILFSSNDLSGYQGATAGATKTAPQNSATLWRTGSPPTSTAGQGNNGFIVVRNFGTGAAANDIDSR